MSKTPLFFDAMQGIGDSIYQVPFVHRLLEEGNKVYLATSVPQIFKHLKVVGGYGFHNQLLFVRPTRWWRTQKKNFDAHSDEYRWHEVPKDHIRIAPHYGEKIGEMSIINALEENCGVDFDPSLFFIPREVHTASRLSKHAGGKPIALIRPTTIRKEWEITTRPPAPGYIVWCANKLMKAGYFVVSVADTEEGKEWLAEPAPPAHLHLHRGELSLSELINTAHQASVIVGGSGFILPLALATRTPLFLILGGRGGFDGPMKTLDIRMDLSRLHIAMPDNFCRCTKPNHNCNKSINDLDSQFLKFMSSEIIHNEN